MKSIIQFIFLAVILPFSSCGQDKYSLEEKVKSVLRGAVPLATNADVKNWSSATILDTRELNEFEISHLPRSVHVGDKKFNMKSVEAIAKTDTIIVYCTVGYRSEGVGEQLKKAGYQNVFNLFGGIFGWKNGGGTVVDSTNKPTERVHCYNESWAIFLTKGEKVY